MTLEQLYTIIKNRKKDMPTDSYVASLFRGGQDRMVQKIGEEATEVVIAAKNMDKQRQIEELADLFFHILILMNSLDITLTDVYKELQRRMIKRP